MEESQQPILSRDVHSASKVIVGSALARSDEIAKISLVIAVRNGGEDFRACLASLAASSRTPDEFIVVDDGSTDNSAEIARQFGARVIQIKGGSQGPARARNRAVREAGGDIICFVDADVCVHPDTIQRIEDAFQSQPDLDAIIGSYDSAPYDQAFFSQYKNLQHSYVHHGGKRRASTFWTGCGAIRREVFLAHDGFDASYTRPCIEDVELGYRLTRGGRRLLLDPNIEVQHRKRWRFWSMVKTDFFDRAVPWTELILRDRNLPNDLNLRVGQRISALLVCAFCLMIAISIWFGGFTACAGWLILFHGALSQLWLDALKRGYQLGIWTGLLWALGGLAASSISHQPAGMSAIIGSLPVLVLLSKTRSDAAVVWITIECAVGIWMACVHWTGVVALVPLAGAVALNLDFYRFLARLSGIAFAVAAIPSHLLYFVYSVLGFALGTLRHHLRAHS